MRGNLKIEQMVAGEDIKGQLWGMSDYSGEPVQRGSIHDPEIEADGIAAFVPSHVLQRDGVADIAVATPTVVTTHAGAEWKQCFQAKDLLCP